MNTTFVDKLLNENIQLRQQLSSSENKIEIEKKLQINKLLINSIYGFTNLIENTSEEQMIGKCDESVDLFFQKIKNAQAISFYQVSSIQKIVKANKSEFYYPTEEKHYLSWISNSIIICLIRLEKDDENTFSVQNQEKWKTFIPESLKHIDIRFIPLCAHVVTRL